MSHSELESVAAQHAGATLALQEVIDGELLELAKLMLADDEVNAARETDAALGEAFITPFPHDAESLEELALACGTPVLTLRCPGSDKNPMKIPYEKVAGFLAMMLGAVAREKARLKFRGAPPGQSTRELLRLTGDDIALDDDGPELVDSAGGGFLSESMFSDPTVTVELVLESDEARLAAWDEIRHTGAAFIAALSAFPAEDEDEEQRVVRLRERIDSAFLELLAESEKPGDALVVANYLAVHAAFASVDVAIQDQVAHAFARKILELARFARKGSDGASGADANRQAVKRSRERQARAAREKSARKGEDRQP